METESRKIISWAKKNKNKKTRNHSASSYLWDKKKFEEEVI